MLVPVYDIKNCGPRHRFAANGKLVHNSDSINLQNLTRGSTIKMALCAPKGFKFIDSDLSQIEARILAWLAGQDDLVEAFAADEDVYKIMASKIYGVSIADVDKPMRFVGKTTILGCGYGMGAAKFMAQLLTFGTTLDLAECQRIIDVYRTVNFRIPMLWKEGDRALQAMLDNQTTPLGLDGVVIVEGNKGIRLPNGLYLNYPNLRKQHNPKTGYTEFIYDIKIGRSTNEATIYGGKLIENIIQALARIVVGEQLVRVGRKYKVVMTVHDAIGSIVPEAEEETGKEYIGMAMRIRPTWASGLPLDCELGSGDSYGGCK